MFIDGVIYSLQSHGGISRLYNEIIPHMCVLDDSLHVTLLIDEKIRQFLPEHPRIKYQKIPRVERYLRPWRLWKPIIPRIQRFVRNAWVGKGKNKIWHSTYFTMPPKQWRGSHVVTVLDMIYELYQDLYPDVDKFRERKSICIQNADAVICISETTRSDLLHLFDIQPSIVHVVPLAASYIFRKDFIEDTCTFIERPFLLYVGKRARYKNFSVLLKAYCEWKLNNQIDLIVVGGEKRWTVDEKRQIKKCGLQERIHLLENVTDEQLSKYYNKALAFITTSLYEGFGIPLLEAMACGCQIVASKIPATVEVAGEVPIYYEPNNPEDLLRKLDVAWSEGPNSNRVQLGLEKVRNYSWEKTAQKTLEVYYALSNFN